MWWDAKELEPKSFASVDVCVAVATPRGLLTPIVKDANKKSLQQVCIWGGRGLGGWGEEEEPAADLCGERERREGGEEGQVLGEGAC